ncbi:hypothetical protein QMK65_29795, partial [Klebsiella pneumoniae]|uniref:hypothetical protein n=1 Tax=Klebsiella pneumoniae TaxID=573 RepID=UPI003A801C0E
EKIAAGKMKGVLMSKLFSKLWSGKERNGEISSSSDTSDSPSPSAATAEETKSTPSRSRRHSVS